jgi:hypothetical protein
VEAGARRRRFGAKTCRHSVKWHITVKAEQHRLSLPTRQLEQRAPDYAASLTRQQLRLGVLNSNRRLDVWRQLGAPLLDTPTVDDLVACDALEPCSWAIDNCSPLQQSDRQILRQIIRSVARSTSSQPRRDCPRL